MIDLSEVLEEIREIRREAREERHLIREEIAGLRTDLGKIRDEHAAHLQEFANLKGKAHAWGLMGGLSGGVLIEAIKRKLLG